MRKLECERCGRVWTSELPVLSCSCPKCESKTFAFQETEHRRGQDGAGNVAWVGCLSEEWMFVLLRDPAGDLSVGLHKKKDL